MLSSSSFVAWVLESYCAFLIAEIEFQLFNVRVIFTNPQNNWFIS